MSVRCNNCQREIDEAPDVPPDERAPCPTCGSRGRVVEVAGTVSSRATVSAGFNVERGLNEIRLAVFGILVGIGLTVGFGVPANWLTRVAAGVGAFALAAGLIRWRRSRCLMMEFMHRLTGQ